MFCAALPVKSKTFGPVAGTSAITTAREWADAIQLEGPAYRVLLYGMASICLSPQIRVELIDP